MAVASGRLRAPAFAAPTSRFRGRGAQSLGILAILILGYILFKNEYSVAGVAHLGRAAAQARRRPDLAARPAHRGLQPVLRRARRFRAFCDWLVTALLDFFEWLTWVGMMAASTLIVLRFGGLRAGLITLFAFVSFALLGLWEESIQTLALMTAAVTISILIGVPIGISPAGRSASTGRSRPRSTRCRSSRLSRT